MKDSEVYAPGGKKMKGNRKLLCGFLWGGTFETRKTQKVTAKITKKYI